MRMIKKLMGCIEAIAATAIVVTTLFSGVTGGLSVNAAEVTDKPAYYFEDDDTMNKNGIKYVMDKEDSAAFKEYFGYFDDDDSRQMNIFYEDSTLRIDEDKSAYSIDDVVYVNATAYKLNRDESGKLTFSNEARYMLGSTTIGGGSFSGIGSGNFIIKRSQPQFGSKIEFSKMTFSTLYNSKSSDGRFQTEGYAKGGSDSTTSSGASSSGKPQVVMCDIDFLYVAINYKDSEGKSMYRSIIMMPDYMTDKTVLHLTKTSDEKSDDVTDNTYTFDAADKDTQVVDSEMFASILKENETKDVVIKSNNNVTFTFAKGTMKSVDGKNEYDFSTTINETYADTMPSYVTKDNFVAQVKFNYSGQLPATASIRIPVGTNYAGTTLYYSLMNDDGTFAGTQAVVVDEEGYMTVKQDHCSEYVITKEAPSLKDTEVTSPVEDTEVSSAETVETPQTSDGYKVYVYASCIIMILAGAVICREVKRTNA